MSTIDSTRRTLAQIRKMPQWQRLIAAVNGAQAAKGWPGAYFSARDARNFGETYIGKPVERVGPRSMTTRNFAAYFVVRQELEHSNGDVSVIYKLKAVYGDDLAEVYTLADSGFGDESVNPSPEWEARTAAELIERAQRQIGRGGMGA